MRRSLCITASLLGAAALTGAIHTFEEVVVEADIGGRMGRSFVVVPDVNGDGIDELLLGDGEWDGSAGSQQGNATLHLGTPDGPDPIPAWTTTGVAAANRLGASVSTGDFNGDDHADLVIGAYNATGGLHQDAGRVYVFYGLGTSPWFAASADVAFHDSDTTAQCGIRVRGEGDLDDDGFDDLVYACGEAGINGSTDDDPGRVHILFGSMTGLSSAGSQTLQGLAEEDELGSGLDYVGDLNGDGHLDLIVASADANGPVFLDQGEVYVHLGTGSGIDPVPDSTLYGPPQEAFFGQAIVGAGDVNGDGWDDVLIGASEWQVDFGQEGRAALHLGSPNGLHPDAAAAWFGGQGGAGLTAPQDGAAKAGHAMLAADLDGDGFDEIVLGAPGYSGSTPLSGLMRVVRGAPLTELSSLDMLTRDGIETRSRFGYAFKAGNLNGDRWPDLAISAPTDLSILSPRLHVLSGPITGAGPATTIDLGGAASSPVSAGAGGEAVVFEADADWILYGFEVELAPTQATAVELTLWSGPSTSGPLAPAQSTTATLDPGRQWVGFDGIEELLLAGTAFAISAAWPGDVDWYSGQSDCAADAGPATYVGGATWSGATPPELSPDLACPRDALRVRAAFVPWVDADGDGIGTDRDCDDADPARGGGVAEVCDGLDNDCNGRLDADPVEFTPGSAGATAGDLVGAVVTVDQSLDLIDVALDVDPGAGARVTAALLNRPSSGGPWSEVHRQGLTLSGPAGFHTFGPFDVRLQPALDYAVVFELHDPADVTGSDASNPPWGTWLGGVNGIVALADLDGLAVAGDGARIRFRTAEELDRDLDGFLGCEDCDDASPTVFPGATEFCNDLDDDCDGSVSPDELDDDGDGFTECEGDCDDTDPDRSPAAVEQCNGVDDDCDGFQLSGERDLDGDGHFACADDCDDLDPDRSPSLTEVCDEVDNDCDGALPDDEADLDGDGRSACLGLDCDDDDPTVFPGATELCDGADTDCLDGIPSDEVDDDGDGFDECAGLDCDDGNAAQYPGAAEVCNGEDDDCDGAVPGDETDDDTDGRNECGDGDCDDTSSAISPGAAEVCDGLDTDCDGVVPLDELDGDGDGHTPCADDDCDDNNMMVFDGAAELCDGLDNDCDPTTSDAGRDEDGDGVDDCLEGDCDDADAQVFPGAEEICDDVDNDCDPDTDEDADRDKDGFSICDGDCDDTALIAFPGQIELCDGVDTDCDELIADFEDVDGDGQTLCDGDCDDEDSLVFEGAGEPCDGLDNDCDGIIDPDCGVDLGPEVEPLGVSVGCSSAGGGGLLAGLLLLGLRRRSAIVVLALLVSSVAVAGSADDAATEAAEFHQAWCADASSADVTQSATALALVSPVLARLSEVYDQDPQLYLLYWRGLLLECTHQDDKAAADLEAFVAGAGDGVSYASMATDATRRQQRIQVRARLGAVPAVPRVMVAGHGGYLNAISSDATFHYGAVGASGSFRLIGPLRLEVFGRLGISDIVRHASGAPAAQVRRHLMPVFGLGATVRLGNRVHPVFGLAFQLAATDSTSEELPVLPGARISAGVELPLVGGRLYLVPRVEAGFLAGWFSLFGGMDVAVGF